MGTGMLKALDSSQVQEAVVSLDQISKLNYFISPSSQST